MGIEIMSIEHEIISTAELEDASHYARACQAKFKDIRHRVCKQREIVQEYSVKLGGLVNARAWEQSDTADEARQARQECAEAAERFQEEYGLLMAMETAAVNAKDEAASARRKVYAVMAGIVSSQLGGSDLASLSVFALLEV